MILTCFSSSESQNRCRTMGFTSVVARSPFSHIHVLGWLWTLFFSQNESKTIQISSKYHLIFKCDFKSLFEHILAPGWLHFGSRLGTNCVPKSSQGTLLGSKIWHFGLLGPILGLRPPKLVPGPPQGHHFDHIWITFRRLPVHFWCGQMTFRTRFLHFSGRG